MKWLALIGLLPALGSAQLTNASAREVMIGRRVFLAVVPSIQKELKLDDAQQAKIADICDGVLKAEGERVRLTLNGDADLPAIEKEALAVLTLDQFTRLNEIWMQRNGVLSLGDDSIAEKLTLTDVQKNEVDALLREGAAKLQEAFSAGDPEAPANAKRIRGEVAAKIERVLTEQQRKDFSALKGKPFRPGPPNS